MSLQEQLQQKMDEKSEAQPDTDIKGPYRDISFDEFTAWLKGFVQGKGYKLPNWDDWEIILNMVDCVPWTIGIQPATMVELEQEEKLTIGEFQTWLKELWYGAKTITKQLPTVQDWKDIKAMMDKVVEEEEIKELKIQPITMVPDDYLKEMEELIDDQMLDIWKKDWFGGAGRESISPYYPPAQPVYPTPQPIWIAPTTITPYTVPQIIGNGGGTGGFVAPTYTTGTMTVSAHGGAAGSVSNVNCNEISVSNVAGGAVGQGKVTFTIGVDSALDGMDETRIVGSSTQYI